MKKTKRHIYLKINKQKGRENKKTKIKWNAKKTEKLLNQQIKLKKANNKRKT